jgi:hypothetical protein
MLDRSILLGKMPRWMISGAALLLTAAAGMSALLWARWPYTQERVVASLEGFTGTRVQLEKFDPDFFPDPGCTIESVTIDRLTRHPLARVDKISIHSSWLSVLIFRKRIRRISTEGLRVQLPSSFPPPVQNRKSDGLGSVVIGEFVANGTTLDLLDDNADEPARFIIHQLRVHPVGTDEQSAYETVLELPDPPGQLKSSGTVGPFTAGSLARIPVAGGFELRGASLDKYKGLAGNIDATGTFHGLLENVRVTGTAVASNFEVNRTGHPVGLRTTYRADVNGTSGDVILETIEAEFLRTHLWVNGTLTGEHGKNVSLDFAGDRVRIEDLLSIFTRADEPALKGPIQLRARAELPAGGDPFLRRLSLRGSFSISQARWGRPRTQMKVNSLSARARGDKEQVEDRMPDRVDEVLSRLSGDVSLKAGTASLSNVSFRVPGAAATGGGTYNLITKRVDLRGTVSMAADASEAASGIKSFFLKPFDRLFRRKHEKGATLPVSITGEYPRPKYSVGFKR